MIVAYEYSFLQASIIRGQMLVDMLDYVELTDIRVREYGVQTETSRHDAVGS